MRGWVWFVRKFGVRKAVWYWREGRRRGWMTEAQGRAFFREVIETGEL